MRHGLLLLAWVFSSPCWGWNDGASTDCDRPLIHALHALGVQYRYGGRSPETGFDCSGAATHVFERAWGILLPPGTEALSKVGMPIKLKELEPGDLVFYNTCNKPYSHVGIYIGDGRFLQRRAPVQESGLKACRPRIGAAASTAPGASTRRRSSFAKR